MDSPDVWMDKDIGDVILRGIQRLRRFEKFERFSKKKQDQNLTDFIEICLKREKQMCQTIGSVLCARSSEVVEYCTNAIQLMNVTEETVKSDPFRLLFCCEYQMDRINMLMDAKDIVQGE